METLSATRPGTLTIPTIAVFMFPQGAVEAVDLDKRFSAKGLPIESNSEIDVL
ncbi:MAG TPA: hypothetical protein VMT95_01085 [Candidatus Binatia bacterium]|nr:hypothetical protein [Candidatus Binatia bacterium]